MTATSKPTALVTGASRGIGRAAALELARRGFHVVAVARAQKALEALDDEIRAAGGECSLVPLDLKDYDGIDRLGGVLFDRYGKLDALAACAGSLGDLTPVAQGRPAMYEDAFAVNAIANQRLIRSLDPLLRASPAGRAAFVTSGAARTAQAFWGAYSASKAALESMVLIYANEVALTPMRVNLFRPGQVYTAMYAKAFPGADPETMVHPPEVAPVLADLLSPECTRHGELVMFQKA